MSFYQTWQQRNAIAHALMAIQKPDYESNYNFTQEYLLMNPQGGYGEGENMPSPSRGTLAKPGATQQWIESLTTAPKSDWDIMKDDPHAFDEQRRYQTEWGIGADYE